jgi:alkylated DNA repair dioxygenase AlkB
MMIPFDEPSGPIKLNLTSAEARYWPHFLDSKYAWQLLEHLIAKMPYRQDKIMMFGRPVLQPRLVCWMADPGFNIKYSGLIMVPTPWDPEVLVLKQQVEAITKATYNSVLINYYRDGHDSMGWHADNEKELGLNPIIASVSLGANRKFCLKSNHSTKGIQTQATSLLLEHGSLLLMGLGVQNHYKHQLPKTAKTLGTRINLTFRKMLTSA